MSFVRLVASEGEPIDGPMRLCSLPARPDVHLPPTEPHMPEAPTSHPGTASSPPQVAGIDQQLEQIDRIAMSHYPDDAAKRDAYRVSLLQTKLREFAYRFTRLEVRQG